MLYQVDRSEFGAGASIMRIGDEHHLRTIALNQNDIPGRVLLSSVAEWNVL